MPIDESMPQSELGRYIISREFSERVGDVVEEAVRSLEERGFKPTYESKEKGTDPRQ